MGQRWPRFCLPQPPSPGPCCSVPLPASERKGTLGAVTEKRGWRLVLKVRGWGFAKVARAAGWGAVDL